MHDPTRHGVAPGSGRMRLDDGARRADVPVRRDGGADRCGRAHGLFETRRAGPGASDDAWSSAVCKGVAQASGGAAQYGHVAWWDVSGSDLSDGERELADGVVEGRLGGIPARRVTGKENLTADYADKTWDTAST